ncbi:GNAT family N-acetyltransferase [Roseivivax sediminis]|uniref:Protein N-acetyltransferase, RimJ/RimL family n=1 Tax=Roseivivax sediminis TaxID=936889 RepID=A0A1I1YWK1_9RHOB|nr:GNAT family N-acetyltransferase [Roseivivax sediminis]SFE23682.1 Protein N-acetyltransferase, RimJ/RimL family [Roseivivax sediminis]
MSLDEARIAAWIPGEKLDLRPLALTDIPWITRFAGDCRVACMTTILPHPLPPGTAEACYDRAHAPDRTEEVWAMDARRSGGAPLAGLITLEDMGRGQSEIGYWVEPGSWNTGLASDAVRALVTANPLGNCTIFGSVFQDNPASARVLLNAGFEYIGDAEAKSVARGAIVPTWTYLKRL